MTNKSISEESLENSSLFTNMETKTKTITFPRFVHQQIYDRLSNACLLSLLVGFGVPVLFPLFVSLEMGHEKFVCAFIGVVSLAVYVFLQKSKLSTLSLMYLGLGFGVLVSYLFTLLQAADPYPSEYTLRSIPAWTAPWIIVLPLIVPCNSKMALGAAIACTVATLLGIYSGEVFFGTHPPTSIYFDTFFVYLFVVGATSMVANIVYKSNWTLDQEKKKSRYELLELLGRGNMGTVWRAKHEKLRRPAAIKIISSRYLQEGDEKKIKTRFEREAQATASLHSPHSIALYDFGTMEDGSFFYVMEHLEGADLESLIDRFGPVSAERAVYFLLQICDSLSDAHCKGLVHRDIKPANIFVCQYGNKSDFIKVMDFGLVKQDSDVDSSIFTEDATLTEPGSMAGTPAFMAPEMAETGKIDHRYDIYGLGCVGYWLLTGEYVFPSKEGVLGVIMAHIRTPPARPSTKTENPIPSELEDVILWCLEKNPADRPQSIEELVVVLREIPFSNPWREQDARDWWLLNSID